MSELSNEDILAQLGVQVKKEKKAKLTPKQERIIAGFEEIQQFVEEQGRLPTQEYNTDEELLAALGVNETKDNDITQLKHVKSHAQKEREKAEEIGTRVACKDFDTFEPMFKAVQEDIQTGKRKTLAFNKDGSIEEGNLFILSGQKAFVASVGEEFIGKDGRKEYRLRVIFDNGVESNQLMRSLQKRLWEDETGRRISDMSYGPLFDETTEAEKSNDQAINFGDSNIEGDLASGTIYVLRSLSDHPKIFENRQVIHKIGVTGDKVEKRLGNTKLDPTYLMADVDIVATYELYNINRSKLENLLHRFFADTKFDIDVTDRFGNPVKPQEWFLVPLTIIDSVIEKIIDGTISNYKYDKNQVKLVKI